MKLGYLAVGHKGSTIKLTEKSHPRKQLLEALDRKHASRIFRDTEEKEARHVGYIVAGEWFTIHEIHSWTGGKA